VCRTVKIWDYQNKTCVQTLTGHTHNVSVACFHPELPIIITGSEDGTVRLWHANTYRLENTLNYGMERIWALSYTRGSNNVAIGYDEGSIMIKMGREEPAMSMDGSGKIIWARHNEIQQANINALGDASVADGDVLALATKDLGNCEVYPQTLAHNPNGRFVVVCGDGEYIIYTALAWRNKSFGSAQEFVWAEDAGMYAVREGSSKIKIYKNFKEKTVVKPDFSAEGIFGGTLLGVRSSNSLAFYDWETTDLIRRIEIIPKAVCTVLRPEAWPGFALLVGHAASTIRCTGARRARCLRSARRSRTLSSSSTPGRSRRTARAARRSPTRASKSRLRCWARSRTR
jgi:coatomer subunit beta'